MDGIRKKNDNGILLSNARLNLRKGEIAGLLGLNNSGKSLLMRILMGDATFDSGRIEYLEEPYHPSPRSAIQSGICYIHSFKALIDSFTIAENIFYVSKDNRWYNQIIINKKKLYEKTQQLLLYMGQDISPDTPARQLTTLQRLIVQLARAIHRGAKIIIIDHILPSLQQIEIDELKKILDLFTGDGVSFVLLDFRPIPLMQLSHRIFVLRNGRTEGMFEASEFDENKLASVMTGYEGVALQKITSHAAHSNRELLRFDNVSAGSEIQNLSFRVMKNEIVGLLSLSDQFLTDFPNIMIGKQKLSAGNIYFEKNKITFTAPHHTNRMGIGMLDEKKALFPNLPLYDNIMISSYRKCSSLFGVIKKDLAQYTFSEIFSEVLFNKTLLHKRSSCNKADKYSRTFISICRHIATQTKLLVCVEPTEGLDVISSSKILRFIAELPQKKCSCLILSTDIRDLISVCNRIYFIYKGRAIHVLDVCAETHEDILLNYQHFFKIY